MKQVSQTKFLVVAIWQRVENALFVIPRSGVETAPAIAQHVAIVIDSTLRVGSEYAACVAGLSRNHLK